MRLLNEYEPMPPALPCFVACGASNLRLRETHQWYTTFGVLASTPNFRPAANWSRVHGTLTMTSARVLASLKKEFAERDLKSIVTLESCHRMIRFCRRSAKKRPDHVQSASQNRIGNVDVLSVCEDRTNRPAWFDDRSWCRNIRNDWSAYGSVVDKKPLRSDATICELA